MVLLERQIGMYAEMPGVGLGTGTGWCVGDKAEGKVKSLIRDL
jgi:hypothetical protein